MNPKQKKNVRNIRRSRSVKYKIHSCHGIEMERHIFCLYSFVFTFFGHLYLSVRHLYCVSLNGGTIFFANKYLTQINIKVSMNLRRFLSIFIFFLIARSDFLFILQLERSNNSVVNLFCYSILNIFVIVQGFCLK